MEEDMGSLKNQKTKEKKNAGQLVSADPRLLAGSIPSFPPLLTI
jgi:hypothetical protein